MGNELKFNASGSGFLIVSKGEIDFLYWKQGLSIRQIASKLKICASTLQKRMMREGIQARQFRKKNLALPSKDIIGELYSDKSLLLNQIVDKAGICKTTFFKLLKKYKIQKNRRTKHVKFPFSGIPEEKAYLQGLRFGDLYACKKYNQVQVQLTTTHPAMTQLFFDCFSNYGAPRKYPKYSKKTKRFEWAVYVLLDLSFKFLLSKKIEDIDDGYFIHFLAGFFDAEGCLHTYNNHSYAGLSFLLYNSDKGLLEYIINKLRNLGFNPKFGKRIPEGTLTSDGYFTGKDLWAVGLYSKGEVKRLLECLPIQHEEKVNKAKVALDLTCGKKWIDIASSILSLRNQIRNDVKFCVNQAALEWAKRKELSSQ